MQVILGWFLSVGEAFALKIASSIDDVVWFSVFLAPNISRAERTKNMVVYSVVCGTQTVVAFVIATSGEMAIDKLTHGGADGFSSERILTLIAASALFLFSLKLGREELAERYGEELGCCGGLRAAYEDLAGACRSRLRPRGAAAEMRPAAADVELPEVTSTMHDDVALPEVAPTMRDDDDETSSTAELKADEAEGDRTGTTKTLAVIACCGSLDDLTLFVPLLVGSDVGFFALLIGSMAAVGVIVAFCVRSPGVRRPGPFHRRPQVFLNFFKRVSDCLQAIPLVCITSAFCAFLVAKAATMH